MARKAARSPLGPKATITTLPAPTGGWNARDALPEMAATDAVILENMIPGPGGVSLRGGYATFATGLGAKAGSLLSYTPPGASARLFAVAASSLYDVTAAGPVGPAVLTGLVSDAWQGVNFGTAGGAYLVAASGADAPRKFDGTSWTQVSLVAPQPATYAGVAYSYPYALTPSKLRSPAVFGSRLWFAETGSLRMWFLPVGAVGSSAQNPPASGGAVPDLSPCAQCLDLSSFCRLGGSLAGMAVWTRDGGAGSDDFAVFLTTAGEVIVFGGTDPTSASTWDLVGVFRVAPPIGVRCFIQAGADLGILTQTGVVPLSSILALSLSQDEQVALTDKIRGAFQLAYQQQAAAAGWQMAEYPKGALVLVNVPQADGSFQQYVLNVLTQAWCCFTGLAATCFGLLGDALMFGTADGRVCQYDVGSEDAGAPVQGVVMPAFSMFRSALQKRFILARPLYYSALGYRAPLVLKTDYDTSRQALTQPQILNSGAPWGSAWGTAWGPAIGQTARWQGVRGVGQVASVLIDIASRNPFRLDHIDLTYETGGIL